MASDLLQSKYQERQELNSPAVLDLSNNPTSPELMDPAVVRQKAKEWYDQADTLTSPEIDPDYENKIKALGAPPRNGAGKFVDRSGQELPDLFGEASQADRLKEITSMTADQMNGRAQQFALEHHRKANKARFADNVKADLLGDQWTVDENTGIYRKKTAEEIAYESGRALPKSEMEAAVTKEELDAMPTWERMAYQALGGTMDAVVNMARTAEIFGYKMIGDSTEGSTVANALFRGRVDRANDADIDTYELFGDMGSLVEIESDDSIAGGLVRGFSQFLAPYTAALRATSLGAKGIGYIRPLAAGFATDFTASQASDGNFSDLLIELGVDNESLQYMSATKSTSQLEGKLKTAIDGAILGEGIALVFMGGAKGGKWVIRKTKDKRLLRKTADMLTSVAKGLRRTRELEIKELENEATEKIANHLLELRQEQADNPMLALPAPEEQLRLPTPEQGQVPATQADQMQAQPDAAAPESQGQPQAKPEVKEQPAQVAEKPAAPPYNPPQEVREAYAQYALAKIVGEGMTKDEWVKHMKGKGHPGLIEKSYKYAEDYIAGDGKVETYYHRTERAILETKDTKKGRTGKQWLQELTGATQGKGEMGQLPADIRPNSDDIKWLGLEDALKSNRDRIVTRDELIQEIRRNRVDITDIDKGKGEGAADEDNDAFIDAFDEALEEHLPEAQYSQPEVHEAAFDEAVESRIDDLRMDYETDMTEELREELADDPEYQMLDDEGEVEDIDYDAIEDVIEERIYDRLREMAEEEVRESPPFMQVFENDSVRYEAYGNDDYGWMVTFNGQNVELPSYAMDDINEVENYIRDHAREHEFYDIDAVRDEARENAGLGEGGTRHEEYQMGGEKEDYTEILMTMPGLKHGTVESAHFDEEDVIVHARGARRKDKAGNDVFFVEEIQSDYQKLMRTSGTKQDIEPDEAKQQAISDEREKVKDHKGMVQDGLRQARTERDELLALKQVQPDDTELDKEIEAVAERIKFLHDESFPIEKTIRESRKKLSGMGQVQAAPVKNYEGMAMRRLIRYAVDEGMNTIAWTTGKMQSHRWKTELGEKAKTIQWDDTTRSLNVIDTDGRTRTLRTNLYYERLTELVGTSQAQKLLKESAKTGVAEMPAEEVVAGKGYKDVYDKKIPKAVDKFAKQWGAKVEFIEMDFGEEGVQKVMALKIPEKMKASAKGGVPLLQLVPGAVGAGAASQLIETESDDSEL